jgi:hypothetical protein
MYFAKRRGLFCAGCAVSEPSRDEQQAGTGNSRTKWRVSIIIFTVHAQKEGRCSGIDINVQAVVYVSGNES